MGLLYLLLSYEIRQKETRNDKIRNVEIKINNRNEKRTDV